MKSVNEMVIGFGLAVFFSLVAMSAYGETVINYDDGSTYTLSGKEEIYVSSQPLWEHRTLNNGNLVQITKQKPWEKRDYVPTPVDAMQPGSHEWCQAYIPWAEGLTFDMITWQRACDTNNDGKYGCGDTQFDDSDDSGVCTE